MSRRLPLVLTVVLAVGVLAVPAGGAVVFQDGFDRGTVENPLPLNGSAPDIRPGTETWSAAAGFTTDGSALARGNQAKAFLDFTPAANRLYTLAVTADPEGTVYNDWISFGFASTKSGGAYENVGPWMLISADQGRVKTAADGLVGLLEETTQFGTAAHLLEIVLDTTSPLWKAEWFVDGDSIRTYAYATNPTIKYVQLGGNTGTAGTFDNFRLSEVVVPEPCSLALFLLGGLPLAACVWRWRRRR